MTPTGIITGEGLSELECASASFAKAYELQVKICDRLTGKVAQIFSSKVTRAIFFDLVADYFAQIKLTSLSEKAKQWGTDAKVSFENISRELYPLSLSQLEVLVDFHQDLVTSSPNVIISETAKPLALFFERTDISRDERMSAVRFIMDIAALSKEIIILKHTFNNYQPSTLGEIQKTQEVLEQQPLDWPQHGLLTRLLDSIQTIDGVLRKWTRPLWEVGSWMRRLLRYRREFTKKIVEVSALGLTESKNSAYRLIVALESFIRWEKVVLEDSQQASPLTTDSFAKSLSLLKSAIHLRLNRFEKMMEVLRQVSSEELEGISVYYLLLLSRHDKLYQSSLQSPLNLDPALRQMFKRCSAMILVLKIKLSHIYQGDLDAIASYPNTVQEQIKYFQYQVPETLLRGDKHELQKLTEAVHHCYNNIGQKWAKASRAEVKSVQGKLTTIVTHATAMIVRFQQAGM